MSERQIIAVGVDWPIWPNIKVVSHESTQTLLDADIVLFQPTNQSGLYYLHNEYADHWRRELQLALSQGETIVVFLVAPLSKYDIDNYYPLSFLSGNHVAATGQQMRFIGNQPALTSYWQEFGRYSTYEMFLDWPVLTPILMSRGNEHVVGGIASSIEGGSILAIPPLTFVRPTPRSNSYKEDLARHEQLGKRLEALTKPVSGGGS